MFPKVNPRQMKKMMRQLGMEMEELEAEEVVIKLRDGEIVIRDPHVNVVKAQNQKTYQITGGEVMKQEIPEDDVKLVASQAGVGEDAALKALEDADGDLAKAIMRLKE
jgi:nascent polypeptide-associated complex subunit alpha